MTPLWMFGDFLRFCAEVSGSDDGEGAAGGGESSCFLEWLTVAGYQGRVGGAAASAFVSHSSAMGRLYNGEA